MWPCGPPLCPQPRAAGPHDSPCYRPSEFFGIFYRSQQQTRCFSTAPTQMIRGAGRRARVPRERKPVMPPPETTRQPHILVVSDSGDASLQACLAELASAGARVTTVADVYTAMAKLALGMDTSIVLLDARTLDERELSFPRLAARYHPAVKVIVPLLDGTAQRLGAGLVGLHPVDVASIVASIQAQHAPSLEALSPPQPVATPADRGERAEAEVQAEPALEPADADEALASDEGEPDDESAAGEEAISPTAAPLNVAQPPSAVSPATGGTPVPHRLSTDGGPEAAPPGPSLHEAVRARMTGDDPRRTRRAPPARPAEEGRKAPLSPEELDALLDDAEERPTRGSAATPDEGGPRRAAEGGGGP
jgi:hypothetical protein